MEKYDPARIEQKWQQIWDENADKWRAKDFSDKPKFYTLFEFPYPSGDGLHMGHLRGQTAVDVFARKKRLEGYNVMTPIGWDSFGLPTENYAIKYKIQPSVATKENIAKITKQEKMLGYFLDWDREIDTSDPKYYRWTQWIFLQLFKHGLAYKADIPINWCPKDKIGLANEEVIDGRCERCGALVIKKKVSQWMLRITKYADKLLDGLKDLDFPERVKTQQINWIGRSKGAKIRFDIIPTATSVIPAKAGIQTSDSDWIPGQARDDNNGRRITDNKFLEVFTTRPDTLFGATFMVVSPEHNVISNLRPQISNLHEVDSYIDQAKCKSDLERTELNKDKTGIEIKGIKAVNPINGEEIPIFIADYVLSTYGTGAIMGVPAHDERDWEFAKKYDLEIKQVVAPFYTTTAGEDAIRPDKETVERKMICAIVKHWKEDKIYCLNWEKFGWHSFVLGGIDDGETAEEAAKREVIEETGYQNIESIEKISIVTHNNFFARHRDENRYSISECFIVTLADGSHHEPEIEHTKNHTGVWKDRREIKSYLNQPSNKYYWDQYENGETAFDGHGIIINSGEFNGQKSEDAIKNITDKLTEDGSGESSVSYKLRDWVFSRQHYWGEPMPIVFCQNCKKLIENSKLEIPNSNKIQNQKFKIQSHNFTLGEIQNPGWIALNDDNLPLVLPKVKHYEPTDDGKSPLSKMTDWVDTTCPKCGGPAMRETDTMPNWAGSSWYFLAYALNQNSDLKSQNIGNTFKEKQKELAYWMPVDVYEGGMEHTTLHLLYSRFWNEFLYDIGVAPVKEPYEKRVPHGIILASDGRKMSKSIGNVVRPDEIVSKYGADTARTYVMFMGPHDQTLAWDDKGISGVWRFFKKVWENMQKAEGSADPKIESILQHLIVDVSSDIEQFQLNTPVAKLMEFNNILLKQKTVSNETKSVFLRLLYPFAPHLCEELWEINKFDDNIYLSNWPKPDKSKIKDEKVNIVIQINSKNRDIIEVESGLADDKLTEQAKSRPKIKAILDGKSISKTIIVKNRLINFVT